MAPLPKYDLFVSYSHADSILVTNIVRRLHEYGIDCFLDNWRLRGGDVLDSELEKSILLSAAGLFFVSRTSLASQWCRFELNRLNTRSEYDKNFRIMPVILDDSRLPTEISHRIAYSMPEHSDAHVLQVTDWIANAIGKMNPGIFGRTGVLTDRVIHRVENVVEALGLEHTHPMLTEISSLLARSGCSVRDAGPCDCGGIVLCGFVDLGLVDWYSNFFHICPDCLRHNHMEVTNGAGQETGAERLCPWCEPLWMW